VKPRPPAILRSALSAAGLLLAGFHTWLLAGRLADPASLAPETAGRYVAGSALLAAVWMARRAGISLAEPRHVLALAAAVLLLHAPAVPLQDPAPFWLTAEAVFGTLLLAAAVGVERGSPRGARGDRSRLRPALAIARHTRDRHAPLGSRPPPTRSSR